MDFKIAVEHEDNNKPIMYQGHQCYVVGHNELLGTVTIRKRQIRHAAFMDHTGYKWLRVSANMLPLVVALVLIALVRWQK